MTFHALREYVMGDDLRHVHWRTTARTGTLMVRQLVDSSLPVSTVVLDTRSASYPDEVAARQDATAERDFDLAVDAVATVGASMASAGFPVTLLTTDGTRHESRSARTAGTLLDLLAVLETHQEGDLAATVESARRVAAGGSLTVVTGPAAALPGETLAACRRRFDRTVVIVAGRGTLPAPVLPVTVIRAASAEDVAAAWRRGDAR